MFLPHTRKACIGNVSLRVKGAWLWALCRIFANHHLGVVGYVEEAKGGDGFCNLTANIHTHQHNRYERLEVEEGIKHTSSKPSLIAVTPVSSLASLRPFGRNQTSFLVSLHTTTRLVARWNITTPAPVSSLSNQQMLQPSIKVTRGTKGKTEGKELDRLTYHQTITRKVFVYWWIGTKTS